MYVCCRHRQPRHHPRGCVSCVSTCAGPSPAVGLFVLSWGAHCRVPVGVAWFATVVCVCVCVASSACGSRRTSVQLNGRWFCSFACVRLVLLPSDVLPALERSASIARRPARGRRLVTWPLLLVLRQLLPTSRPRHAGNAGNNCPCLAGLSGAVARLRIAGKLVVCIARRSPANRQDVAAACITMALGACC